MASLYIQEMKRVQQEGPYFVVGYSFGGLICFEIAQRLQRQGHKVALVALIDAGQPIYRKDFANVLLSPKVLGTYIQRIGQLLTDVGTRWTVWSRIRNELWRLFFLKFWGRFTKTAAPSLPRTHAMLEAAKIEAAVNYKPIPFEGRLSVFRVEERITVDKLDRYLGWGGLASDIDVYDVPGDHVTVCEEPHVAVFAEKFRLAIQAARNGNVAS
jgi:thioesterase domain-containing protein